MVKINKTCGIYCIENLVNGKMYIGQSKDIKGRFNQHTSTLRRNKHKNEYLQKSWNKYGESNFKFYVLLACDIERLDNLERKCIQEFKTLDVNFGYNIESGGNLHKTMSESSKKKLSKAKKGKKKSKEAIENMRKSAKKDKIVQIDFKGNLIRIFESTMEIVRILNIDTINIRECCKLSNKNRRTSHGYIWMYYDDYNKWDGNLEYYIYNKKETIPKRVIMMDKDENTINTFDSAIEAKRQTGIPQQNISECCRNKRKTAGGYVWKFE